VGEYAATQAGFVIHYLRLAAWPTPLVFDYGTETAQSTGEILPFAIAIAILAAATIWALWHRPGLGFLGLWFFAILAPTSSVIPVSTQVAAEHRMYLPLAAVIVLVVLGAHALWSSISRGANLTAPIALTAVVAVVFGWLTYQRNEVYRSAESIWADTVRHCPRNYRAQVQLGLPLIARGKFDEAIAHYRQALEINPDYAVAHYNLGDLLLRQGEVDKAISHLKKALEADPDYADANVRLGDALAQKGEFGEAFNCYEEVLQKRPDHADARAGLALQLARRGKIDDAIALLRKAVENDPNLFRARVNLGLYLTSRGALDEAIAHYRKALEIEPNDPRPCANSAGSWR
jgi:Flp pilus assembly protein TadD